MIHSGTAAFELARRLERWFLVERAIPVGRAARGLLAVLKAWRADRPRCRVAMPGAICHEVLLTVLAAGCEPAFCDVDPKDGLVPESEWSRVRALGAEVAIVVHLYGNPAAVNSVRAIFPAADCLIIDDAAQALGSHSDDGLCGSLGDVGLLSFGRSKQISIGNGALLVRDRDFARKIEAQLTPASAPPQRSAFELQKEFRSKLDAARTRLAAAEFPDAGGFAGLLNGMEPVLDVPFNDSIAPAVVAAIERYPQDALARSEKARIWEGSLRGTGLSPVGMGSGCVPWRYACRLPGIDWRAQMQIAEAIRGHGIHTSTWYLPANWFVGRDVGALSGVEALSREVFQFWLDESTTADSIVESARTIGRELTQWRETGSRR